MILSSAAHRATLRALIPRAFAASEVCTSSDTTVIFPAGSARPTRSSELDATVLIDAICSLGSGAVERGRSAAARGRHRAGNCGLGRLRVCRSRKLKLELR